MKIILPEEFQISVSDLLAKTSEATENVAQLMEQNEDNVEEVIKLIVESSADDYNLAIASLADIEKISLTEAIVKRVSFDGTVQRMKDRKTRKRQAYQTTGLSSSERRRIARRAARTLRQRPAVKRVQQRKRKRAMKRRASMGVVNGQ